MCMHAVFRNEFNSSVFALCKGPNTQFTSVVTVYYTSHNNEKERLGTESD